MEPELIEIPSSPDNSVEMDTNAMAIEPRRAVDQGTLARGDPLRQEGTLARGDPTLIAQGQRDLEMRAEIYKLRTELSTQAIAGQQRIQEVHEQSRALTRTAMTQQYEAFQGVARQFEDASAEGTLAAVHRERSHQEAEQHRQLKICRSILQQVETRFHNVNARCKVSCIFTKRR